MTEITINIKLSSGKELELTEAEFEELKAEGKDEVLPFVTYCGRKISLVD